MSAMNRWLVVVGWALPVVATPVLLAHYGVRPRSALDGVLTAALLLGPILPFSVVLLAIAVFTRQRNVLETPHRIGSVDQSFVALAVIGIAIDCALLVAAAALYLR